MTRTTKRNYPQEGVYVDDGAKHQLPAEYPYESDKRYRRVVDAKHRLE